MPPRKPKNPDPPETAADGGDKPPRLRLIVDVQPEDAALSAAVQLRASKRSVAEKRIVSKSEVVTDILKAELAAELAELEKYARDQGEG